MLTASRLPPWCTASRGPAHDHVGPLSWLTLGGVLVAAGLALFGLPHVPLPMPTWEFGVVTPTCGLTRASVALSRGDVMTAWNVNPASFAIAAFAAAVLARLVVGLTTRTWINVAPRVPIIAWIAIVAIWWANQQVHADLIMNTRYG